MNHNKELEVTDTARVSISLNNSFGKNLLKMLQETEHGRLLLQNGFEEDLKYAAGVDTSNVIPYLSTNVLKPMPGGNSTENKR